jgi:hypothetical protein
LLLTSSGDGAEVRPTVNVQNLEEAATNVGFRKRDNDQFQTEEQLAFGRAPANSTLANLNKVSLKKACINELFRIALVCNSAEAYRRHDTHPHNRLRHLAV